LFWYKADTAIFRKSQLAIEYCYRFKESHPDGNVLWVHSSSVARFIQSFTDLARALVIPGWNDPKSDLLQLVKDRISQDSRRWLVVLDNVDNPETLYAASEALQTNQHKELINYLPDSLNVSTLITTRDKRLGADFSKDISSVVVSFLSEVEAKAMLRSKLPDVAYSDVDLARLAADMEHLPLAITQAAAFIVANNISLTKYLEVYHTHDDDMKDFLDEERPDPRRDYESSNSVTRTWKMSFDQLVQQNLRAAEILSLMAMLDRQGVPEPLLRQEGERQIDFIKAIGALQALSLIATEKQGSTYEMHRLVQLSMQRWLEMQNTISTWQDTALLSISKMFPHGKYETAMICKSLLPHAQIVTERSPGTSASRLECATLLDKMGSYYHYQGQYAQGVLVYRRSLSIRKEHLRKDHPATLATAISLASILGDHGKYDESEAVCRQVLKAREKELGTDHIDWLASADELASILARRGKIPEAELMNRRAMNGYEKILGKEHPDTIVSLSNLASILHHQNKLKEAEEMNRRVVKAREDLLGNDHPDTLSSLDDLAYVLAMQGKTAEAEELNRRALDGYETLLGKDHPETLLCINNLILVMKKQDKYEEAEQLNRRVLVTMEKTLGAEHPDTLASTYNLASAAAELGKYKESEELYRRVLRLRDKVLGSEHPETITTAYDLALVLSEMDKDKEALDLIEGALIASEKVIGKEDLLTLKILYFLAFLLEKQDRYSEAAELYARASAGLLKVAGPDDQVTKDCINDHAALLKEMQEGK
jgi:tetratricopeptide (TPR) repeat protein